MLIQYFGWDQKKYSLNVGVGALLHDFTEFLKNMEQSS
jgi:hypothetical protein